MLVRQRLRYGKSLVSHWIVTLSLFCSIQGCTRRNYNHWSNLRLNQNNACFVMVGNTEPAFTLATIFERTWKFAKPDVRFVELQRAVSKVPCDSLWGVLGLWVWRLWSTDSLHVIEWFALPAISPRVRVGLHHDCLLALIMFMILCALFLYATRGKRA